MTQMQQTSTCDRCVVPPQKADGDGLRVLFITGASHRSYMVNMNHYQRVYFLSRQTQLTVFGRKGADFSLSAAAGTEIVRAPFQGKLGVILACVLWMIIRSRSRHYDIVLTEPSKLCICGLVGKLMFGAKWVVDVWDIPFRCQSRRRWRRWKCRIDRIVGRRLFRLVDLFILSILPHLEFAEFDVPHAKTILLRNAIWVDGESRVVGNGQKPRGNEFHVLCARSCFTEDSGLDLLVEAFDHLSRSFDDVRLMIVGRIPSVVEPQVARLRGRRTVDFRDFMEHGELVSLMASSQACVIPFRNTQDLAQTYPIKVIEYLSRGAVVIAPNLPGIAAMVQHGHNGLLFEPDNADDLATQLRRIYDDRAYASILASRAANLGSEYDCRKKAQAIFQALVDLACGSGKLGTA